LTWPRLTITFFNYEGEIQLRDLSHLDGMEGDNTTQEQDDTQENDDDEEEDDENWNPHTHTHVHVHFT